MGTTKKIEDIREATDIFLRGSICLSDIPKDCIYVSPNNGKKYISIVISKMKEADTFRDRVTTHDIKLSVSREDKARGQFDVRLGKLQEYKFMKDEEVASPQPPVNNNNSNEVDDLPF